MHVIMLSLDSCTIILKSYRRRTTREMRIYSSHEVNSVRQVSIVHRYQPAYTHHTILDVVVYVRTLLCTNCGSFQINNRVLKCIPKSRRSCDHSYIYSIVYFHLNVTYVSTKSFILFVTILREIYKLLFVNGKQHVLGCDHKISRNIFFYRYLDYNFFHFCIIFYSFISNILKNHLLFQFQNNKILKYYASINTLVITVKNNIIYK